MSDVKIVKGSMGDTDYSREPGVQTYEEVYGKPPHAGTGGGLRLSNVLKLLGAELREAQRQATEDPDPDLLRLKDATVELGVTWELDASGGVEFWVFKLGGEVTKSNTQTVTITMEPINPKIPIALAEEEPPS